MTQRTDTNVVCLNEYCYETADIQKSRGCVILKEANTCNEFVAMEGKKKC